MSKILGRYRIVRSAMGPSETVDKTYCIILTLQRCTFLGNEIGVKVFNHIYKDRIDLITARQILRTLQRYKDGVLYEEIGTERFLLCEFVKLHTVLNRDLPRGTRIPIGIGGKVWAKPSSASLYDLATYDLEETAYLREYVKGGMTILALYPEGTDNLRWVFGVFSTEGIDPLGPYDREEMFLERL